MVNARFPKWPPYSFEKVDAAIDRNEATSIGNRRTYQSVNFLAKLRQIKPAAITWDLFRTASQLVDETTGREMFFLLRLTFWLGLVLVLLPREKTPESEKLPQIGASEAVQAATAAMSDMGQFCKRQPAACEVGGQAASVIGVRAQEGARRLYQIITDKRAPDHTGSIGGLDEADPEPVGLAPHDTLTQDDLVVEWRGLP
jgi:Family of unknown function (DUF5330)